MADLPAGRPSYPLPVRVLRISRPTSFSRVLANATLSFALGFLLTGSLETSTPDDASCPADDYRRLRREGYYVGSGLIESACKTLVAARCKLAGMHWRHKNAAAVALLRATLRSNFLIVA